MRKFRIVPKQDFGSGNGFYFFNLGNGKPGFVKSGFVVTDGFCNIMPGATWFRTVGEAMDALRVYLKVEGRADAFWREWHARVLP